MGVPKFFRFISERYPCLSEVVKEYELPEFDNFYIDANGIIHNCSHPDDSVHFRITEEQIFKDIFHYLEMLFRLIKPKKLFFIAIDGVAPRAKMNQQRSRRFRTARDAEKAVKDAVLKGEKLPDTDRFDSNCITPGTIFMEKLQRQLQFFIKKKISSESIWQKPKIILSGHNVPGEGEHKIMDYIRYLRSQSDWDPNTRHCLHGLDADLIMLGLCTHEPHFSLLREEVKFGRHAKKTTNVEETKFFLLHLSLMRDYLDLEFQELKTKLPFPYDLERIIDDWVLMGFLVGNDFIPHLPHFHIANNALCILYKAYIDILPTLDGYINNYGTLNLVRFEKYLEKLAETDFENFKDLSADLKYFESKTGKKFPGTEVSELFELAEEVLALSKETDLMLGEEEYVVESDDSSDNELREEFRMYKADFYKNKLEYEKVDSDVLKSQAECYVRAIQWNLFYYYLGCPSWSWYYPYHYSPYVSDVKGFASFDINFPPSKPFLPFEQLLAVLPAASKSIIPEPFQDLMTSPESPIINFYPSEFETDLNGKQHDWEAVVLIPFIDENSLLSAMESRYASLTEEEKLRNSIKPMEIYEFTKESLGRCDAPEYFAPISDNHAMCTAVWSKDIKVTPEKVVKGLLPGAMTGVYLGFPHLCGISFTAHLSALKVKVFDHPSRGLNMILKVLYDEIEDDEEVDRIAHDILGKVVFVGWPHIQKGKVTSIHTEKYQYKIESGNVKRYSEKDNSYLISSEELLRSNKNNLGIDLKKVDVVLYVKTVGDIRLKFREKSAFLDYIWSKNSRPFPYQTTLKDVKLLDDVNVGQEIDLSEIFNTGREVFILDPESRNYGALGLVKKVNDNGCIDVEIEHNPDLDVSGILDLSRDTDLRYYPGNIAAQRLGLSSHLFSRVTGTIFIQNIESEEKLNIGLGLKFSKQGEELIGFTRREGCTWLYSDRCTSLLDDYMAKFPELFEYLEMNSGNDIFFNKDVFPENSKEKVNEIKQWLKEQPHMSAERRPSGARLLTDEAIKNLENRILTSDLGKILNWETVTVSPSKLYIPTDNMGKIPPDTSVQTFLLDRVVNVRKNHNIPLGMKGTVVGFDRPNSEDTLYDIIFDAPIPGGRNLSCDEARVYRLPSQAFINISHRRKSTVREPHLNKISPGRQESLNLQNLGNNKVKQFFDGYMNSGKVTSPQERSVAPNTDWKSGADSEFKAMWNVLLNRQVPDERASLRPEVNSRPDDLLSPVDPIVVEQTKKLREVLKLDGPASTDNQQQKPLIDLRPQVPQFNQQNLKPNKPPTVNVNKFPLALNQGNLGIRHPAKSCGHVSCYSDLIQICASKSIAYPLFKYNRIKSSGEVLCTVSFYSDFGNVVGDACRMEQEAAENAACKAIRLIMQQDERRRAIIPTGLGYRLQHPGIRPIPPHTTSNQRFPGSQSNFGQLPSPPTKWCQSSGWPMGRPTEKQYSTNKRPSPRTPTTPTTPTQASQQKSVFTPSSVIEACTAKDPEERASEGEGSGQHMLKGGGSEVKQQERHYQVPKQQRRGARGRTRPRLAANFSVPLGANKQS